MSEFQEPQVLYVLAASYDSVDDARADLEAIRALYNEIKASDKFDAAVLTKDKKGKVHIDKTYEAGTRHDALRGLGWGLAAGAAAAIFPAIGIGAALAAGGVGGSAIGALVGHHHKGMDRGDLKELGDVLDSGQAGLIVVYQANLADQVAANLKAVNRYVSAITDVTADQIADEIRQAGQSAS
jgi:uncharacterized membrane protein